jgi:signal peptidase II
MVRGEAGGAGAAATFQWPALEQSPRSTHPAAMTDSPPTEPTAPSPSDGGSAVPSAPRLLPPSGTAEQPPIPSVVGRLPAAAGGGPSYVDTRSPSYVFLAAVSIVSLVADIATKAWAARRLEGYPGSIPVWKGHLAFVLAKNKGGAWGLLQTASESVRRPFFLLVSVAAIAFIVTLYRKLTPQQKALKWGLPLVLGGALGNVFDRIRYGSVIDFIDFHVTSGGRDHHWPTFNVADIAICVGVGLMAVDMFTSKRPKELPPVFTPGAGFGAVGLAVEALAEHVGKAGRDAPPPPVDPDVNPKT